MRATLEDRALTGQAGRFVWLALDFDKPANQPFLKRHRVGYTPTFLVLDPKDERAVASHTGGMTTDELLRFLDEGERGVRGIAPPPAEAALAEGDACMGSSQWPAAASHYRAALAFAAPGWTARPRALAGLEWALWSSRENEACAESARAEAPALPRDEEFARVVLAGLASANNGGAAAWAPGARVALEPLAAEAVTLPGVLVDHRFQLFQNLERAADARGDTVAVERWADAFLDTIEAQHPANDDARSALDIARVDAATNRADLVRILPALQASAQAMPGNYNAWLRLAETFGALGRNEDARLACERGLVHVTGPVGRSWLLHVQSDALAGLGRRDEARRALVAALAAARTIGNPQTRANNMDNLAQALARLDSAKR